MIRRTGTSPVANLEWQMIAMSSRGSHRGSSRPSFRGSFFHTIPLFVRNILVTAP